MDSLGQSQLPRTFPEYKNFDCPYQTFESVTDIEPADKLLQMATSVPNDLPSAAGFTVSTAQAILEDRNCSRGRNYNMRTKKKSTYLELLTC